MSNSKFNLRDGYRKLVIDPVKSYDEFQERKRKHKLIKIVSLLLFIIPIILMVAFINILGNGEAYDTASSILTIPILVGAVGLLFSALLGAKLKKIKKILELRQCQSCKALIEYDDSVDYKELRRWEVKKVQSGNNGTHVYQTVYSEVLISCVCQKCGTKKEFKEEFRVEKWTDGSLSYSYDLDELIEGLFKGTNVQIN